MSRIVIDADWMRVYSPFEARELIKTFPVRSWDSTGKCWTMPTPFASAVAEALRALGLTVMVTNADGTPYRAGTGAHGHREIPASSWADTLFDAVGPDRIAAVHRALSTALHPDREGGSVTLQQQLNVARDRRRS